MSAEPAPGASSLVASPSSHLDRPWFALATWCVAFVGMLVTAGLVAAAFAVRAALDGERSEARLLAAAQTPAAAWWSLLAPQLATVVVVLVACRILGVRARERLGLSGSRLRATECGTLLVATIVPFALAILAASGVARVTGAADANPLMRMWSEGSRGASAAWVLCIALVPGIVEECFFRGFVQRTLLRAWRPAQAIAVTSVLFGLAHVEAPAVVFAALIGAWLGIVAWRTGSVALSIAMHVLLNGAWTAVQMLAARSSIGAATWNVVAVVAIAVGLATCVPALGILRRRVPAADGAPDAPSAPWPTLRGLGRSAAATLVAACLLFAVIPPGATPPEPLRAPTIAQLVARAGQPITCPSDGEIEIPLAHDVPVRIALPEGASSVDEVVVALDDGAGVVWLAYAGEASGKGKAGIPRRGIVEQLVGGEAGRLRIRYDDASARPLLARVSLLGDEQRIDAALAEAAAEGGWSTRGRRVPREGEAKER